jgi:hypothetical protein
MNLTYRGVSYDGASSETLNPGFTRPVVDLKYRGVSHRLGEVAKTERLGVIFKYRGVEYGNSDRALSALSNPALNVESRARVLTMNRDRSLRNRLQSMLIRSEMEVSA